MCVCVCVHVYVCVLKYVKIMKSKYRLFQVHNMCNLFRTSQTEIP